MSFLAPDDYILAMDITGYGDGHFTDHDLTLLHEAGIRTLWNIDLDWNKIEPSRNRYDWSTLDCYMDNAVKHGFKVILNCFNHPIQWASDHWYVWSMMGPEKECISPWSREGMDYMLGFHQKVKDRYTTPYSLVINSHLINGEWLLPNCQIYSGADQRLMKMNEIRPAFIGMMIEQTKVLGVNPWNEVWMMLHPHLVYDDWLEEVAQKYQDLKYNVNWMLYTWKPWPYLWQWMDEMRDRHHMTMFGGAEWASGILDTTPHAIGHGLRGLLCGPCHPYTHETEVKPWMCANIQKSIEMFRRR